MIAMAPTRRTNQANKRPPNPKAQAFGHRLRILRDRRGLTQEQISERLGLSARGYQHYESGRSQPKLADIDDLARALECDPCEIVVDVPLIDSATLTDTLHIVKLPTPDYGADIKRRSMAKLNPEELTELFGLFVKWLGTDGDHA